MPRWLYWQDSAFYTPESDDIPLLEEQMHIALISPAWPAMQHSNGIITYVEEMRNALVAQGHKVSIFSPLVGTVLPGDRIYHLKYSFIDRLKYKLRSRLGLSVANGSEYSDAIISSLRSVHRADPIDVVEMEETFGWCGRVASGQDIPVIVKLHGPAFLDLIEENRDSDSGRTRIVAEGTGLSNISAITSPAMSTLRETVSHYGLSPTLAEVVPNPMALANSASNWRLEDCDRHTLLFVGRFDKRKGGDLVLLAFKKLLKRNRRLRLMFVGPDRGLTQPDGSKVHFEEFLNANFDPSEQESITFEGQTPRDKVFQLRRKAMVTLVLSRWDNQPNTVLEAMMQGCPVLAFSSGGVAEIIEDGVTGMLVADGDIDALCVKLEELMRTPSLAVSLGANARQYIGTRHSPATVASRTVDVYRRAIAVQRTEN